MLDNDAKKCLESEIKNALSEKILRRAVFSRFRDRETLKTVAVPFDKDGEMFVKCETFRRDGKALHNIISAGDAPEYLSRLAFGIEGSGCGQVDLLAFDRSLGLLISEKGRTRFTGTLAGAEKTKTAPSQDKNKNYILKPGQDGGFLYRLGIAAENGAVHDKKQAKYRQINKFLEQIEAVYDRLPKNGVIYVCDLCCGKSYLTFAVYWYFTYRLGRETEMYGVDLKADVIEYCTSLAQTLGWSGMHFQTGDVSRFIPPEKPHLVISLHACDTATDYVLAGAVRSGAEVILSTPCCQHELNAQLCCPSLGFITEHSMLKQKLAAAATDALRAKMLEICGYKVTVCKLIDPEETPKNLLIRAVKRRGKWDLSATGTVSGVRNGSNGASDDTASETKSLRTLVEEYNCACRLLGVTPTLAKLLMPEDGSNK